MLRLLCFFALLFGSVSAHAASAIIYVETTGCQSGSTTRCSGTTDSATATASGASATITCSATSGPASAPGCSLSGTPDLSGVATDGSQAIFINCATNSNQKIFFINAVDDGSDLVGTTVTPTGCTAATSDWGIGGRLIWAPAAVEAALRAGDTVQFNDGPASSSSSIVTSRTSGDGASGSITLRGKSGSRPVLATSGSGNSVINGNGQSNWRVENLEIQQTHASSGNAINTSAGWWIINTKISDAGTSGISNSGGTAYLVNSEITNTVGDGVNSSTSFVVINSYIHGTGGDGIQLTGANTSLAMTNSIVAGAGARGVYISGASTVTTFSSNLIGNIIYGSADSGLEITDADTVLVMQNNIFMENGNAAGEYNVEWAAGSGEFSGIHAYNTYYHSNCQGSGTGGPACVSGLTVASTELTSDPLFTNAGSGDFSLQTGSPARATGYPGAFLGGPTGYISMGAVQPSASASAAGIIGGGL